MEKKKLDKNQKTSMTRERQRLLEEIDFKWAKQKGQTSWEERFAELVEFKRKVISLSPFCINVSKSELRDYHSHQAPAIWYISAWPHARPDKIQGKFW